MSRTMARTASATASASSISMSSCINVTGAEISPSKYRRRISARVGSASPAAATGSRASSSLLMGHSRNQPQSMHLRHISIDEPDADVVSIPRIGDHHFSYAIVGRFARCFDRFADARHHHYVADHASSDQLAVLHVYLTVVQRSVIRFVEMLGETDRPAFAQYFVSVRIGKGRYRDHHTDRVSVVGPASICITLDEQAEDLIPATAMQRIEDWKTRIPEPNRQLERP